MPPLTDYIGLILTPTGSPAIGDLPMRGASGGWTTLPIGTPNQVLITDPVTGLPKWTTSPYVSPFVLTPLKTANYTAAAFDWVRYDTSSGAKTLTLPAAPSDKARVGASLSVAGNTLTITAGGTDSIQGGSQSLTATNQAIILQYDAAAALWIVQSITQPVSSTLPAPTAVKNANYTAAPNEFVMVDASTSSPVIKLPSAPTNQTLAGMKIINIAGGNTVTFQTQGTDVFDIAGGSTTMTLSAKSQSVLVQYKATGGLWVIQSMDAPLSTPSGSAKLGTDGYLGGPGGSVQSPTTSIAMPKPQMFECHGHSYDTGGGASPSDLDGWTERLWPMLGASKRNIRAAGGAIASWYEQTAVNNIPGSGSGGFARVLQRQTRPTSSMMVGGYLPATTLFLAHYGLNDLARLGGATPGPFIAAMRTILSRALAVSVDEAETSSLWTYPSGTWSTTAALSNQNSGTGMRYISAGTTGTANYTTPTDFPAGRVVGIGIEVPGGAFTCTVTIQVAGVTRFTLNLNTATLCDQNAGGPWPVIHTVRIGTGQPGDAALPAGATTISVAFSAITGGTWGVDFAQVESNPLDGPVLLVPNLNREPTYSLWNSYAHGPLAGTDPMNDTSVANYNTALAALLAEFAGYPIISTNLDTLLNANVSLFGTDQTHPNNEGHAMVAQQVYQDIVASGYLTPRLVAAASLQGNSEWYPLQLQNSWVPYATFGIDNPSYRRTENGIVYLKGAVKNGSAANANIAQLPVGYRPDATLYRTFATWGGGTAPVEIVVQNDGIIRAAANGSTTLTSLDGVQFPVGA